MKHLLADALHIFIIFMMAMFVVGGILAATGTFDHWGSRYKLKQRRRQLMRDKARIENVTKNNNIVKASHYYTRKPDKESVT